MSADPFHGYPFQVWDQLQEFAVYRAYDADGYLLYVGCTSRLRRRLIAHKSRSPWFAEMASIEFDVVGGRWFALHLERVQIITLAPLHNKAANRRRGWGYHKQRGGPGVYFPERDEFADTPVAA